MKKKPNYKVFKSEEWLKSENLAKNASRKWVKAGRPRDENNPLYKAKKETNHNLRGAIKQQKVNSTGYTSSLNVDGNKYQGDAQVLSGFFKYHDEKSTPPEIFNSDDNHLYFYSTIDVEAISYIVKQRKWKLPQLNYNQVQNLISRLKVNKSPDYYGFSARHIKHGGSVSVNFLKDYLNLSFKFMEYGVPSEELVGVGSLVHKAGKKSLSEPQHFRRITVCALLGQLKQMAVCDITLPILKTLKSSSQLGFTPGLFVKMANIMMTEKRGAALAQDLILLAMFLDAEAAFDRTLHPIILSSLFNAGVEDEQWKYFQLLHDNASTHIKWNGRVSNDVIFEKVGNRQGGYSSADEWKIYGNPMIKDLEGHCMSEDITENRATNVIAIADDVAPCVTAENPREVLHRMQIMLNIVENHGTQSQIKFGKSKCKLLITARPGKLRKIETLLNEEPNILTFYDEPIKQVDDFYVHIGVPQAPRSQSKHAVEYCITKGQNMTYKLQSSTQNSLCGISPLSNRKMFLSYHQPSFMYGLDTLNINKTDMAKMETKYRQVLKHMLSMPECVSSPLVYLTMGVLPATAQRDLEIMGLLGQLSITDDDNQNVRQVVKHNLAFFDDKFGGWSGVVRRTALEWKIPGGQTGGVPTARLKFLITGTKS